MGGRLDRSSLSERHEHELTAMERDFYCDVSMRYDGLGQFGTLHTSIGLVVPAQAVGRASGSWRHSSVRAGKTAILAPGG